MKNSTPLIERRTATRGLNLLAAGGIVLVLATASVAMIVVGPDRSAAKEIAVAPAARL